jgi:HD-GYP domain-containing protein (c-di-GMP phosphodiesterase class II)
MLILSITEVRPGAKLALGVTNPRHRDQELLKAGFVMDAVIIGRLKAMGVTQVFVEFPGLEDLDSIFMNSLSPERQEMYQQVRGAIVENERNLQPVVRFGAYIDATRNLVKSMIGSPGRGAFLDVLNKNDDAIEHATSVAHLALVLGIKLDGYLMRERSRLPNHVAKDVTHLGVAAMLHDIGKSKLPKALQQYHSLNLPQSQSELAEWQKHAQYGYEMIRRSTDATTAATVLQHHQNYDGSGGSLAAAREAKTGLSEGRIHAFARILRVADLYDRLSLRPDGSRRTNYEVLHLINARYAAWLDPEVVAALPQVIPPFSPGRRVTLSDGSTGIVIGFNTFAPYQPTVKRIDLADQRVSDEVTDLKKGNLRIIELDGTPLESLEGKPEPAKPMREPLAA